MNGTRTILAGRYELGEVIGRGGMGTVYAARDLVLRRSVAVKVLSGAAGDQDPTSVARFEREGRAAAARWAARAGRGNRSRRRTPRASEA